MWGPQTIAKLVQITPITLVYDAQVTIPICSMVLEYLPTFALVQNHPVL